MLHKVNNKKVSIRLTREGDMIKVMVGPTDGSAEWCALIFHANGTLSNIGWVNKELGFVHDEYGAILLNK